MSPLGSWLLWISMTVCMVIIFNHLVGLDHDFNEDDEF